MTRSSNPLGTAAGSDLRRRGINLAADALATARDHILAFFAMLRAEMGFYLGCHTLHARLTAKGEPTCWRSRSGRDESL